MTHDEKAGYGVLRLLDFNVDAVHYQIFKEKFSEPPTFEQVKHLTPLILHVPVQSGTVIKNKSDWHLLGHVALSRQDLEGYAVFLKEALGDSDEEIEKRLGRVLNLSKDGAFKLQLVERGDGGVMPIS